MIHRMVYNSEQDCYASVTELFEAKRHLEEIMLSLDDDDVDNAKLIASKWLDSIVLELHQIEDDDEQRMIEYANQRLQEAGLVHY
jgi:ABC-type phosphate/phosphonate transport system substrate-binding protein